MKISNIFLILVLTLGLVSCQDFTYFPAGGATDVNTWDANEGQILRHIYSTTVYYTGATQYDAKTIDLTATFNGKLFDADEDINVAASLIAFDAQFPGQNSAANDKFNYVEVKNIAVNGGRTAVTLTIGFVRPNVQGDVQAKINKIGYSIICVGSKFGKSSDASSLSRVYARTSRIRTNLNKDDSTALFTFPGLTTDDTPFGFSPTSDEQKLCGTQNGKVYIQGCATYKILTTVAGFSHIYTANQKYFRVATIPVNNLNVAPNKLKTDGGDFGQNSLQVLPENIYPYGIYLNYDPGAPNTPQRTTYDNQLSAVQASIVVVMIRREGYNNYPANLLHEDGQFVAAFGARGYYSDADIVNKDLIALTDSHKLSDLKLSNYDKQNMGHLYLGLQQIDHVEKFDFRVTAATTSDYTIKAYNKQWTNDARGGVGALLFSTVDVCTNSITPILSGTPSIVITPASKATASSNQYIPVTITGQTRNLYQYTVNAFDSATKVTVSVSHNYVIPANVDTVIFDVQLNPTGTAAMPTKVQYTIKIGTKTVGPFGLETAGTRQLILQSVTPLSTVNAVITIVSDNTNSLTSVKISEGLFYYPKVVVNGQCVSTCPNRPGFTVGYDFTTSPKSCIYCQTSINQEYATSNNGQCICKDNFVAQPNTTPLQCIPCTDSICRKCQISGLSQTCDECVQNAFNDAGTCKCKNFFYKSGSQCLPCAAGCTACTSTGCSSCKASTNAGGVVTRDQVTCLCKEGFYEDSSKVTDVSAICESCSPTCVTCLGTPTTCTKCNQAANFVLKNSKCVCADGYYLVGSNCVKCSSVCATCAVSSVYCTSCPEKRALAGIADIQYKTCKCQDPYVELDYSCIDSSCSQIDAKCQTCGIDLTGLQIKRCLSCIDNRVVSGGKCVCKPGFYEGLNGKCTPCPNGCQSCTSAAGSCQCANNAFPDGKGGCTCQNGLFLSTFANGPYCKPCSSNCATCEDNENKCLSCKPTFTLNDQNVCVCPGGTYPSGGQCVPCGQNCLSCNEANKCLKCADGYKWDPVNFKCSLNCPDRKYNGGSECLDCSAGCAQCVSEYICNNCDPTFNLYAGSCRPKCPDTTYAKDGKCYPCNPECNTCQSPDICDSCNEPFILQAKKCVKECSDGTYFASSQGCISCDSSCKTCKLKSNFCTSCSAPQVLYQNQCYDTCPVAIVGGVCTDKCPDGKFLQGKACVDCDPKCKTCQNSQSNCLSCTSGLSYNGDCVDSCPSNTFVSGQTCIPCDISCKTCSDNAFKCSSCANGYIKSGDYCVRSCEPGTFFDIRSSSCLNCGTGCKVCTSASVCTTCYDPKLSPVGGSCQRTCPNGASLVGDICVCNFGCLHNSVCVSTCPDGFYATNSKTCAQCSFPCLTCSGSANNCSSCVAGYTFDPQTNTCSTKNDCPYGQVKDRSGNCRRICDHNSFYYKSGCVCSCPPGFNSNEYGGCIQAISPSVCTFPLFQQGSSCVYNCQNRFYPDSQARLCKPCAQNCLSCLSDKLCISCASGYSPNHDQSKCIQTSDCDQNQFKYNNRCYSQCPVGTYPSDRLCYRSCRKGTFLYNELCYSTCPTDFCTTEACFPKCPSGVSCTSTKN